jgi:hypothetical protein
MLLLASALTFSVYNSFVAALRVVDSVLRCFAKNFCRRRALTKCSPQRFSIPSLANVLKSHPALVATSGRIDRKTQGSRRFKARAMPTGIVRV